MDETDKKEIFEREKIKKIVVKVIWESIGRGFGPLIITLIIAEAVIHTKTALLMLIILVSAILLFIILVFFVLGYSLRGGKRWEMGKQL